MFKQKFQYCKVALINVKRGRVVDNTLNALRYAMHKRTENKHRNALHSKIQTTCGEVQF